MTAPRWDRSWPTCVRTPRGLRCEGPRPGDWPHPDRQERASVVVEQLWRAMDHLRAARRLHRKAREREDPVDREDGVGAATDQIKKALAHLLEGATVLHSAQDAADARFLRELGDCYRKLLAETQRLEGTS